MYFVPPPLRPIHRKRRNSTFLAPFVGEASLGVVSGLAVGESYEHGQEGGEMLWTILGVVLVLWLLGLITNIGGGLIHLLLVVALVVLIVQLVSGRKVV